MQIVVASNCHGNLPALASLLTEVERLKERRREVSRIYLIGILGVFPYAREVYELLSSSKNSFEDYHLVTPIKGKHDYLIEKPERMEVDDFPDFEKKALTFAHEALGHEGRKWLRISVPSSLAENFGNNRFYFTYSPAYSPASEDVLPKMPTSYYESILSGLGKYDVIAVAGYQPFVIKTRYGKVVCPGSISIAAGRDAKPSFAVIDVETTAVEFFNLEYSKSEVERKVKESGLPEEIIKILHHGFM